MPKEEMPFEYNLDYSKAKPNRFAEKYRQTQRIIVMEYNSSIQIKNSSHKLKTLILEPWAEDFEMPPGKTFSFIAKAAQEGNFEVEIGEDEIIVFAWASSTVKVFCEGEELNCGAFERQTVPVVPKGQSVSSFLSFMFGKK